MNARVGGGIGGLGVLEAGVPGMGNWKTWVLETSSQLRPGPPPAFDSAQRAADLAEVKNYQRDSNPFSELFFWPEDPAGRPAPGTAPVSYPYC